MGFVKVEGSRSESHCGVTNAMHASSGGYTIGRALQAVPKKKVKHLMT
jgi:hypothetical protein